MSEQGTRAEGVAGLLLAIGSLLVVTCSLGSSREPQNAPPRSKVATAPGQGTAVSAVATPTRPLTTSAEPSSHTGDSALHSELAPFWSAVADLSAHRRQDHVRILWLGDSHTSADFWVEPVRAALGQRFGFGGPGYLQIGLGLYRHGSAQVERGGSWRTEPALPSYFVKQQGDGVYGLAGLRSVPKNEKAWATIRINRGALSGRVRWQILYRLPKQQSRFSIELQPGEVHEIAVGVGRVRESGLSSVEFESSESTTLRVGNAHFEPELFGVVVEGSESGVVVDTLGINGARIATALTWEASQFEAEVRTRKPELVVLAYGTNEIGDALAAWRYGAQYDALLERLRRAVPAIPCLILGPADRALPDWTTNPRTLEIEQVQRDVALKHGCEFFSILTAMGGPGSLQRWAFATPPLARKDRVHLTVQGYTTVGENLAHYLMNLRGARTDGAEAGED